MKRLTINNLSNITITERNDEKPASRKARDESTLSRLLTKYRNPTVGNKREPKTRRTKNTIHR